MSDEIRAGDVWRCRNGQLTAPIEENVDSCTDYCWKGKVDNTYKTWTKHGYVYKAEIDSYDLIELYNRKVVVDNRDSLDFFREVMGGRPVVSQFET